MGISLYTALQIKDAEKIKIITLEEEGKYGCALFKGELCRPEDLIISSEPTFNDSAAAIQAGEWLIRSVKQDKNLERQQENLLRILEL